MICRDVIDIIEKTYPPQYAMEWDNVGLLVGSMEKDVKRIYIALDATDEVIQEAIDKGADLLLTHHPMIFKAMKRVTEADFIGRRICKLIRNDISYYAMHTNYDVMGMAELAGRMLSLEEPEVLEVTKEEAVPQGLGRVADLKEEMTLEACCRWVKESFQLPNVKVFGNPDQIVTRLAICPGSGKSVIGTALQKGADVMVTGDIDHHEGIDANAQGMAIIDAGHYGIEQIYIEDMRKFCEKNLKDIKVDTAEITHPFWIV